LIARHDGLELFLLRPNNPAAALQLNGQWAAPLLAESWFGYDIRDVHESEFYQWWDWTDGAGYPFSEAKGDPRRLSGALGMLAAAHYLWTQRAESVADLDDAPAGSIAVLKADADRLFGQVGGATVHMLPGPNHQSKGDAGATAGAGASSARSSDLRARIEAHEPMLKNGSRWQHGIAAVRAELLRQYKDRMQVLHAESATAEEKIGELWDLKASTVHAYLTVARKVTQTPADFAGRKRA